MEYIKESNIKNSDLLNPKSEQVQTIVDRMPVRMSYQAAFTTMMLVIIIFVLGFIIKYPDTIDGRISITSLQSPVRLIANNQGKIILLCDDKQLVEKGGILAYIDNAVDYNDIIALKEILNDCNGNNFNDSIINLEIQIGELMPQLSRLQLYLKQLNRFQNDNIYKSIQRNIGEQIHFDKVILTNIEEEIKLRENSIDIFLSQHSKDSLLFESKSISEVEFKKRISAGLEQKASFQSLLTSRSNILSKLASANIELDKSKLEEFENSSELEANVLASFNELRSAIEIWDHKYLVVSPVDGIVEFMDFWRDNSFVKSGAELFSVIPNQDSIFGEIKVASFGAGKISIGQIVNVKLDDYPFDEYGLIKAKVVAISELTGKIPTNQGDIDGYRIIVNFPDKLVTSFGLELRVNSESKGKAEIITKPKRLIHRLFDNLKANTVE